jgi:hypothetical protein
VRSDDAASQSRSRRAYDGAKSFSQTELTKSGLQKGGALPFQWSVHPLSYTTTHTSILVMRPE